MKSLVDLIIFYQDNKSEKARVEARKKYNEHMRKNNSEQLEWVLSNTEEITPDEKVKATIVANSDISIKLN